MSVQEVRDRLEAIADRRELRARTPSGAWIDLHDRRDPAGEAKALIDRALKGSAVPPMAVVVGIGGGFLVDELQRRRPDIRILALELLPELASAWSGQPNVQAARASGHLLVGCDPTYEVPVPAWPHTAIAEPPLIVVHPAIAEACPEARVRARAVLKQFLYEQRANAEARARLAGTYFAHTLENLPILTTAADVSALDGIAKGHPLVLIGAGPSLDRLIPSLQTCRQRAWYVALDTALKPLIGAGIIPDLVVSIDPTTLNGRHLLDLPSRERPWLVAEMSLDPKAVTAFAGRIFACTIGRADPWPWLETLGLAPTRLRAWGSVLTASCDLFMRMRASRVIFAGMDLAYTKDQPYCRETSFEEDWEAQQARDQLPSLEAVWEKRISEVAVQEIDLHGRKARTAPQMIAFRNWVRNLVAAASGVQFFNATEAGILHGPGIEQRPLPDALSGASPEMDPGRRLQRVATPAFTRTTPALVTALDAVADGRSDAAIAQWRGWQESIPNFDAEQTRSRLVHAARRLRALHGAPAMATNDTGWIDVPYDQADFWAKPPLQWNVTERGVMTYAYRVQGKTMTLAFKIDESTLAGLPSNELYIRIPGNYLPNRSMANPIWLGSQTGKECGYLTVHPGRQFVVLFRETEGFFPIEPKNFVAFGQLTFEVQ